MPSRRLLALPILATLALAGCVTPEAKVRSALVEAGLSRPVASCMAERMVDQLSYAQLERLRSLAKLGGDRAEDLSVRQLVRRLDALGDPEIVSVVTSSGLRCAIAAG